jgi:hypothetical protein
MTSTRKLFKKIRRTVSKYTGRATRKSRLASPPDIIYGRIHANWCGHCKELDGIWKSIVRKVRYSTPKDSAKGISIEQKQEAQKIPWVNKYYVKKGKPLAIQGGYPTLFKIVNAEVHYYNGERTPEAIAKWIVSKP